MTLLGKTPATRRRPRRGPLLGLPLTIQYALLGGLILGICVLLISLQPRVASLITPPTPTPSPVPRTVVPTATATATIPPRPSDLPSPTPTATLRPTPTATSTPAPAVTLNATVEVTGTAGVGLILHTDPGRLTAVIRVAKDGERLMVVAGPQQADGLNWWRVRDASGLEGWVVESYLREVSGP